MRMIPTLMLALLCSATVSAHAQWQWTDKTGRKVFSDQPPGAEIPESAITRRPGGGRVQAAPEATAPSTAKPATTAVTAAANKGSGGKDTELEKKKKQAESQDAERKKEEDAKHAAQQADNCERAKRNLATLQSGIRVTQTNAQGEREFMSDQAKAAELSRTQGIVDSNCK